MDVSHFLQVRSKSATGVLFSVSQILMNHFEEQGGVVRHRNAQYTRELCDFIRDMLHTTPEERPSVQDVLEFTEELLGDDRS
jgi:hypothetical protein